MARSATHFGTCQCCGKQQKLPGNRMSKHGYTVQWGFFSGTCPGAGHLPFEQDKSLAEKQIAYVDHKIADTKADIAHITANPVDADGKIWHSFWVAGQNHLRGAYKWAKVEIRTEFKVYHGSTDPTAGYWTAQWREAENCKWQKLETYSASNTEADVLSAIIARRVTALTKHIAELDMYITWQRERCAAWQPKELTPVT
jgi:hypothetical protein